MYLFTVRWHNTYLMLLATPLLQQDVGRVTTKAHHRIIKSEV